MIQIQDDLLQLNSVETEFQNSVSQLLNRSDLGYLSLKDLDWVWDESVKRANELKEKYSFFTVLGMGGSALGAKTFFDAFPGGKNKVSFWCDLDPRVFHFKVSKKDLKKTHWLIISKSGKTIEVLSMINFLNQVYQDQGLEFSDFCTVITEDTNNPLHQWALNKQVYTISHPQNVGGRFSVFSPVGLLPLALLFDDLSEVRSGVEKAFNSSVVEYLFSRFYNSIKKDTKAFYFWFYDQRLYGFADWLEQLWSESLGKPKVSIPLPIICRGNRDQHSLLQQIIEGDFTKEVCFFNSEFEADTIGLKQNIFASETYLDGNSLERIHRAQQQGTQQSIQENEISNFNLHMNFESAEDLAELMMSFQLVIGALGEVLKVNVFDQPGVERAKVIAREILTS